MIALANDEALRERLAGNAKKLVAERYSREAFAKTVNEVYGFVREYLLYLVN